MTLQETHQCEALVLAVDEATRAIGEELLRIAGATQAGPIDWPVLLIENPGDALRRVHHFDPGVLLVCASAKRIDDVSALIDAVRQRRPQLSQLAVAATHDERVERAVRAAGASHYFAIDSEADRSLLRSTLVVLGVMDEAPHAPHSGLSPPRRAARSPRTRARGYEGIKP